jgi:hypothetical protein
MFVPQAPPPQQSQDIASGQQMQTQQTLQNKQGALAVNAQRLVKRARQLLENQMTGGRFPLTSILARYAAEKRAQYLGMMGYPPANQASMMPGLSGPGSMYSGCGDMGLPGLIGPSMSAHMGGFAPNGRSGVSGMGDYGAGTPRFGGGGYGMGGMGMGGMGLSSFGMIPGPMMMILLHINAPHGRVGSWIPGSWDGPVRSWRLRSRTVLESLGWSISGPRRLPRDGQRPGQELHAGFAPNDMSV